MNDSNYTPERLISYVVASDTGLAPNVTGDSCTLTVCKPVIRRVAATGKDWVLGFSTPKHGRNRLIYAMQVDEKIPYGDYFKDKRFQNKKPDQDLRGDNFFKRENGDYKMAFNSAAHYGKEGPIARDLKTPVSVVGHRFWYFGENAPEIPTDLAEQTSLSLPDRSRRGHRVNTDEKIIQSFVNWIEQYPEGIHGRPRDLAKIKAAYTPA